MIGPLLRGVSDLFHKFIEDRRGNFAIIFGVALIPVAGMIGAAIDYGNAARIRGQLQDAADAASVGAIARGGPTFQTALSMAGSGTIAQGKKDALAIFNADVGSKYVNLKKVNASVKKSGTTLTSTVDFTADAPAYFMGIFGVKTIPLSGSSTAVDDVPVFVDFYLLLDNTPSMGVGATPADITKMVNNTKDQCAFACHDLNDPNNYYNLAKKLGVTSRIDVLRTATQKLMDTASDMEVVSDQFRFAIYTFGPSSAAAALTPITTLTADLAGAKSSASVIDLMTVNGQGQFNDQDTDYDKIFPNVSGVIPTPGNGNKPTPQAVLFFVSDGVADENNPKGCMQPLTGGTRCQEPIDPKLCKTMKARGIKIAILYTTYLPLPTNAWYNTWVAPFDAKINPAMEACASPGLFFEVSPTQGISQAMAALFTKAVTSARLSQ